MFENKSIAAIIPARSGSKRLPQKNVLEFLGKPLVQWTIEAAKNCSYVDEVIVTTNDEEVKLIASELDVSVLHRPKDLSSDTASSVDVVIHAVENLRNYDVIILLQPTSPLRNSRHIEESIEIFLQTKNASSCVSITETEHSPLWTSRIDRNSFLTDFKELGNVNKRSQDLESFYRLNGAIYICYRSCLLVNRSLINNPCLGYLMSVENSIDIDTQLDFKLAELIAKARFR